MMECKDFIMKSASDGLPLSGFYVKADGDIRGIVQLVHGMAEHKERYLEFMQYLAKQGYLCVMLDHRGHGKSVKNKNDLGYFYDRHGSSIVEDAHQLTAALKEKVPHVPFILFGHSMGSLVVRAFAKRYDQDIDALIVCGSPSRNPMAKLALVMVHLMERFKGDHYRSSLIHNMAFSSYPKRFKETGSENVWLSANQNNVREYDADDGCGFVFTLNGFENLFHLMVDVYDDQGWNMHHKDLPILFIAGRDDPCIDTEKKFEEAYGFMKKCGYRRVDHHLFDGMRHEILNEDDKMDVYRFIQEWIQSQNL